MALFKFIREHIENTLIHPTEANKRTFSQTWVSTSGKSQSPVDYDSLPSEILTLDWNFFLVMLDNCEDCAYFHSEDIGFGNFLWSPNVVNQWLVIGQQLLLCSGW